MTQEVLKLALEALEAIGSQYVCRSTHHTKMQQHHGFEMCPNELTHEAAITAMREALAQPQKEPDDLTVWRSRALQAEAVIDKFMAQPQQEPDLTEAFRTELDKLSQRNYKLRMENAGLKAQPQQEPVAWMYESVCGNDFAARHKPPDYGKNIRPLYTTPPPAATQHERKPLTDEQILEVLGLIIGEDDNQDIWDGAINAARAIEAAHGIKENT